MITFVEWLVDHYFGEPAYRAGNGHSEWDCPFCGKARKFTSMKYIPGEKDRARCWSCQEGGDDADILKLAEPDLTDWSVRRALLEKLLGEYEAERAQALKSAARHHTASVPLSFRGRSWGGEYPRRRPPQAVFDAYDGLTPDERGLVYTAVALARSKCPHDIDEADGLMWVVYEQVRTAIEYERRVAEENARHMAGCKNDRCTRTCCRKARGWSDLAIRIAQRRARERVWKQEQQRAERVDKWLRAYLLRQCPQQSANGRGAS
jgi:hypothetical protein